MELNQILIVDDSATSRLIIKKCFDMAGFGSAEYREAGDGLEGLVELADRDFDLIVTDVNMPKMDGRTFVRKLKMKGIADRTSVLVITSQGDDITARSLMEAGASAVLAKPISPAKVAEVVEMIRTGGAG